MLAIGMANHLIPRLSTSPEIGGLKVKVPMIATLSKVVKIAVGPIIPKGSSGQQHAPIFGGL